jgi:long-chain fatty acid transport protein
MAGGAYDPTPVTNRFVTPDLPDADHIVITAGAAVKPIKRFTILAACEFLTTPKRNSTYDFAGFGGTFWTQAITPGLAIYYNF